MRKLETKDNAYVLGEYIATYSENRIPKKELVNLLLKHNIQDYFTKASVKGFDKLCENIQFTDEESERYISVSKNLSVKKCIN